MFDNQLSAQFAVIIMEQDDQSLVRKCLDGDTSAFGFLIDKYQKPLFNVALRMLNDHGDAEDVTQTVLVRAFEKLDSFDPQYKFFSWIYKMTINESLNFLSRRRRLTELDDNMISGAKNPDEKLDDQRLKDRVQQSVASLQPQYKTVIILRHFEGFSYSEISQILDLPVKTVKSRLFTARQLLCDILRGMGITADD